jgi:invasion protein IalB
MHASPPVLREDIKRMSFYRPTAQHLGLALAALMAASPALAQTTPAQPRPAQPAQPRPAQPGAPAQQPAAPAAQGPAVVQLKPEPRQYDWVKVCPPKEQNGGKELCVIQREFVSDEGQPVMAIAVYDTKGEGRKVVFVVPPGFLLQPGLRYTVDNGKAEPARFQICLQGCFAESLPKDDVLNAMRRGNLISVSLQNQFAREVVFQAPLTGFGKAFDGPGVDPATYDQQNRQLREQMEKQAEERRRALEAQGAAPAAPGAAAPAPAAPKP